MNKKMQPVGRIAFREEGEYWNAYFADRDTMNGAILLGSIRMNLAMADRGVKKKFMNLMRAAFSVAAVQALGEKPGWRKPVPAPEHERTKE